MAGCSASSADPTSSAGPGDNGAASAGEATTGRTKGTDPTSEAAEVLSTASVAPAELPDDWAAFDESLKDAFVGSGAYGLSIAVAKDGKIVHTAAVGVADPDTGRATKPSDRYRFASNSKLLTAIVTLQLVEDGKLGLDEPVLARLAKRLGVTMTDPRVATITVRQLLGHLSGFPTYQKTFFASRLDSCEEAAAVGLADELAHDPGTDFTYSNMNFCLLGLLIEDVAGTAYEDVVTEKLLEPLGIDDMRMAKTQDVRDGEAHHLSGASRKYLEVLGAAGAWVGTAEDLARILDSLDTTRKGFHPLSAEMVAQMLVKPEGIEYPFASRWYGLGMRIWVDGSWGHTGTVENAHSMVLHRPDGITWVVLVNGDVPKNTDELRDYVDAAFEAVGVPTTTTTLPPTTAAPTTVGPSTSGPGDDDDGTDDTDPEGVTTSRA